MSPGIRAEVQVDPDGACPVLATARAANAPARSVAVTSAVTEPDRLIEELSLQDVESVPDTDHDLRRVFAYGAALIVRLVHPPDCGCPRSVVAAHDTPVVDLRTSQGQVRLVFHAADMTALQGIMAGLQDAFPTVDVRRLLRSEHERPEDDLLFVDRSQLTDRQREVLETAHRMGYFDRPKGANAGEVADALDITRATFAEHLAAAQTKLYDAILGT